MTSGYALIDLVFRHLLSFGRVASWTLKLRTWRRVAPVVSSLVHTSVGLVPAVLAVEPLAEIELGAGLFRLTGIAIGVAELEVDLGIVRRDFRCRFELGDTLSATAGGKKRAAQVLVVPRRRWIEL